MNRIDKLSKGYEELANMTLIMFVEKHKTHKWNGLNSMEMTDIYKYTHMCGNLLTFKNIQPGSTEDIYLHDDWMWGMIQ